MTKKGTKDVAVVEDKPSYLAALEEKGAVQSNDNFDSSDVVIPRIKLLQGISPEVTAHDDAESGHFWHTGFDQDLGDELNFLIVSRKKKYLLVAPMDDGQGVLARSEDAVTWDKLGRWEVCLNKEHKVMTHWEIADLNVKKSGLADWGTQKEGDDDSPPAATMFYEYVVILPDFPELGAAVISLARSSIKPAKKGLNDKIELQGSAGRPLQALVFRARTTGDQNGAGQAFNNWQFAQNGFAPEELYNKAVALAETMGDYKVQDEEGVMRDDQGGANEGAHAKSSF